MEHNLAAILEAVSWPLIAIAIGIPALLYFRSSVKDLIDRLEKIKVAGIEIQTHMGDMSNKISNIERINRDVYSIIYSDDTESDAEKVRDEVWRYVAFIMEKLPEQSAFDLRKELNAFHLANMRVPIKELKKELAHAGLYSADEVSEEITPDLVDAIISFQQKVADKYNNEEKHWVDGIVGPHTWKQLTGREVSEDS